jgi:hypothetical protein
VHLTEIGHQGGGGGILVLSTLEARGQWRSLAKMANKTLGSVKGVEFFDVL